MDNLYREIILEHWKNPQNYGLVKNPDIDIENYNPLCGDKIHLTVKIENRVIRGIRFTGEGCAISKAAASILTKITTGLILEEIREISPEDFLKHLEIELTPARLKCGLLAYSALQKGINTFSKE